MEKDLSKILYRKYFGLSNRKISITLKNGKTITGVIAGFFKGQADSSEPFIIRWHIVPEYDKFVTQSGIGTGKEEMVAQRDIAEIYFEEDNSTMKF